MLTVTLTWALFSLLGMLPFYLGGYIDNVTDAYFETMSGFTTTGSTILTDIEALPHGILFWRSLTQWQGGIGMIVFTVALMPIIGGGATQMFNAETPGITHERFRPRVTQVTQRLWGVYLFLTIILIGLLWAGQWTCMTLSIMRSLVFLQVAIPRKMPVSLTGTLPISNI